MSFCVFELDLDFVLWELHEWTTMNMINFASSQLSILTCWKSRLELPKNIGANENDLHKMYNLFLNQSKLNNVKLFLFYHLWMPCKNTEQIKKQKSHSYSCCFKAHHFLIDSYQDKYYCLLILKIGCFTTFNFWFDSAHEI